MKAIEIIEYLRTNDSEVKADGEYLELSPAEKVTEELIQRLQKQKPEILKELQSESRRQKVLNMLAENPDKKRAYTTDTITDPDNVILTVAIRGVASFEMLVPLDRYDAFLLMKMLDNNSTQ
jgi:predicted nucleic acid-binding protein